jgi:hypothetical protein
VTTTPPPTPPTSRIPRALTGLMVAALGVLIGLAWWQAESPPPQPMVFSPRAVHGDATRCAECHSDVVDQYPLAPHARTLQRITDRQNAAHFVDREFRRDDSDVAFRYRWSDRGLHVATDDFPRELAIEWLFGSGTHAQTPLLTATDEAGRTTGIEHSVSWYPPDTLGVTLAMDDQTATRGGQRLGRHWPAAETAHCFGCHSTHVPTENGQIDFEHLVPNIGCSRCHPDTQRHLDEVDRDRPVTIERLSSLSPLEAVDRCGECHRRASEMGGAILPDDQTIVRFAPVGLVQSPCFQKQGDVKFGDGTVARLDCASCHDPHRPANHDWRHHTAVCANCHDAAAGRARDCAVAPRTDNCLPCHMPGVPANANLKFTDHWIRVRRTSAIAP